MPSLPHAALGLLAAGLVTSAAAAASGLRTEPSGVAAEPEADADQESSQRCPDLDDDHGRWHGNRTVGGVYTLTCAPGFKVSGEGNNRSAHQVCPENLAWPEDLRCENKDDCANLKHGCGALGVCIDHVNGYECNCIEGTPERHTADGEIICGTMHLDEKVCGGHTCGASGICVDVAGNLSLFEDAPQVNVSVNGSNVSVDQDRAEKSTYRCECEDGFFDDGKTCSPMDCGKLHDELGNWTGSALFGGEYTLRCEPGAFVWGGFLQDISISCGIKGRWVSKIPKCVSPTIEASKAQVEELRFWFCLSMALICIVSAALAAGLTLGFVSLDSFNLMVILETRLEDCSTQAEKDKLTANQEFASKVRPLVRDHHLLLVTLLLFNTLANEALPVFLDELVPSWLAVVLSVTVVFLCSEILPSAIFTGPNQFAIAACCVPLVKALQILFMPVAMPVARMLDRWIYHADDDNVKYSRAELRACLKLHGPGPGDGEDSTAPAELAPGGPCPDGPALLDSCMGLARMAASDGSPMMASNSGDDDAGAPSAAAYHTMCCVQEERVQVSTNDTEHAEHGPAVLAASELRLLNGALFLTHLTLDRVAYARAREWVVAEAQALASEVVTHKLLHSHARAVLVLKPGKSPNSAASSPEAVGLLRSGRVRARAASLPPLMDVAGALTARQVLRGGNKTLESLLDPLVNLASAGSALDALRELQNNSASIGVVKDGSDVVGVVTRAEILQWLFWKGPESREDNNMDNTSFSEVSLFEPITSPSLSPTLPGSSGKRAHPLMRKNALSSVQDLRRQMSFDPDGGSDTPQRGELRHAPGLDLPWRLQRYASGSSETSDPGVHSYGRLGGGYPAR